MGNESPGEMLREWRRSCGYTQHRAARLVPVGQSLWSAWEKETHVPSIDRAFQLEELTGGAVPARAWAGVVLGERAAEMAAARAAKLRSEQRARKQARARRRARPASVGVAAEAR